MVVADHRGLRLASLVGPAHRVAGGAALAAVSPTAIKAAIIDERVNLSMVFSFSVTREAVLGCHLNKGGMLGSNVPRLVERTQLRRSLNG